MARKRIRKLTGVKLPTPEEVWAAASSLVRTAYFYDIWTTTGKEPSGHREIQERAVKRALLLRKLDQEYPSETDLRSVNSVFGSYEVSALAKIYERVVKEDLSRKAALKLILSEFEETQPDHDLSRLVLSKDEIRSRQRGHSGGPIEAAVTMIGRVFYDLSKTKMRELLDYEDQRPNRMDGPGFNLELAQIENEEINSYILKRMNLETAILRICKVSQRMKDDYEKGKLKI